MVIRGKPRGNGKQLARYLLTMAENDNIQILDVVGRETFDDVHLHEALLSMSLTAELTKSDKGLYHAQINPAYGEDKQMTPETWFQAADLLAAELGLENQRRVIVLHTKNDRTHAHVVWERYDREHGKMISDSFSRLAQDRARKAMELMFEHKPTPERNKNRPEMKKHLTALWGQTQTGKDFIREANKAGYQIAAGVQRRPFMVVDETGRSFDLVRQLQGIKTKEVRDRLQKEKLPSEKQAIANVRKRQQTKQNIPVNDNKQTEKPSDKQKQKDKNKKTAEKFSIGKDDILMPQERNPEASRMTEAFMLNRIGIEATDKETLPDPAKDHAANVEEDKKNKLAQEFAANTQDHTTKKDHSDEQAENDLSETEKRRQEFREELKAIREKQEKDRGKGWSRVILALWRFMWW